MAEDIAVVDIYDVVHFLAAELTPQELRVTVNQAFAYLSDRKLSGRLTSRNGMLTQCELAR